MNIPNFIKNNLIPPIFIKLLKKLNYKNQKKNLDYFVSDIFKSYSQFNEDLIIDLLFNKKKMGFYVDIGANDPEANSNTKRFYDRGWRGINIEPNINAYQKIKEARKEDININIAISKEKKKMTFFLIGNDSSISTLDYKQAIKISKITKSKISSCEIETESLSNILNKNIKNIKIDLMSIDTEGHEVEVIESNDWNKYRPTVLIIESNINTEKIVSLMKKNNYLFIFSNKVNAIFIDNYSDKDTLLS